VSSLRAILIDPEDARFASTVSAMERELVREKHVMRYASADDFGLPVTAFLICRFWLIDARPGHIRGDGTMRFPAMGIMLAVAVALAGLLHPLAAISQDLIPPEVVQFENVHIDQGVKVVAVGNASKHYSLICNVESAACITPEPNKNYLLFNKKTRWKMPGAKDFITLAFIQDWTVTYNKGENIGLVPETGGGPTELGMFVLDPAKGAYDQDTIISDGPIIYGTGLSDEDRHKAWGHFFMQMVEACARQQGTDTLGLKLAKRCLPGQDFCTTAIDANLVGIGGIQEPRKVVVIVATDVHDPNKQLSRMVCTWPIKGKRVCRD
jgi:hypothetical protein